MNTECFPLDASNVPEAPEAGHDLPASGPASGGFAPWSVCLQGSVAALVPGDGFARTGIDHRAGLTDPAGPAGGRHDQ
ncbi:MAG: hypothetical protein JWO49_375 [Arthrobacter sp.]|nr:hypothetical protein [Arthrobacter sp.]MCU1548333.1 hypothetical protein [Arthrobacter sp.]